MDEQPGSYSRELETIFGLKYLNALMRMRIRNQGIFLTRIRNSVFVTAISSWLIGIVLMMNQ